MRSLPLARPPAGQQPALDRSEETLMAEAVRREIDAAWRPEGAPPAGGIPQGDAAPVDSKGIAS